MKGIILAGGKGTRLNPCTLVTNKHLIPVYDKPMVYYPLSKLVKAGLTDILIVSGPDHSGHFAEVLGDGSAFGCKLTYAVQREAGGIAQALGLAEDFADGQSVAVILGDNIFSDEFTTEIQNFNSGAQIFTKSVSDPERFGVAVCDGDHVTEIIEKPKCFVSDLAVTGMYLYDATVFAKIKTLTPSARGEFEITDVNNMYIESGQMRAKSLTGYWTDAGTFQSLFRASSLVQSGEIDSPF